MNHDAPMTPAAMQAHIAELEQQLKLSVEGVSQRGGVWSWSSSCWLARPSLPSTAPRLRISPLPCRSCSTTPAAAFRPGNA